MVLTSNNVPYELECLRVQLAAFCGLVSDVCQLQYCREDTVVQCFMGSVIALGKFSH